MKKGLFVFFLFCGCTSLHGQKLMEDFKLLLGVRLHRIDYVGVIKHPIYWHTSPEFGLMWEPQGKKYALGVRRIWGYNIPVNTKLLIEAPVSTGFAEISEIDFQYKKKLFKQVPTRFSLGYYFAKKFNHGYFYSGGFFDFKYHAFSLGVEFEFGKNAIELKKHFAMPPFFDVLLPYLFGISVHRRVGLVKEQTTTATQPLSFLKVYPVFSLRLHPVKYHFTQNKDLFNAIGISPGIGLEFLFPKYHLSANISRDYWVRVTGGLDNNDLIGFIATNTFAVQYHHPLKTGKTWRMGLGFYPIYNKNEPESGDRVDKDRKIGSPEYTIAAGIKGIGITTSYEFYQNFDVEFRQIFPFIGDEVFSPWYTSLGVVYRWRE